MKSKPIIEANFLWFIQLMFREAILDTDQVSPTKWEIQ